MKLNLMTVIIRLSTMEILEVYNVKHIISLHPDFISMNMWDNTCKYFAHDDLEGTIINVELRDQKGVFIQ